jgi:hypothetical protein
VTTNSLRFVRAPKGSSEVSFLLLEVLTALLIAVLTDKRLGQPPGPCIAALAGLRGSSRPAMSGLGVNANLATGTRTRSAFDSKASSSISL